MDSMLITPGYGCAQLHLGQSKAEVRAALGRPYSVIRRFPDAYFYVYLQLGIDIDFGSREGRVHSLFFYRGGVSKHEQANIVLDGGIGFRSTRADLMHVFGNPDTKGKITADRIVSYRAWIWYREGVQFEFDAEGNITVISITKPAAE